MSEVDIEQELCIARQIELVQMKALRASLIVTLAKDVEHMNPSEVKDRLYRTISDSLYELDTQINNLESKGYKATGFTNLQREAMVKYGEYGLLIEELRDSANGKLPGCFNDIGNILALWRDLTKEERTLKRWQGVLRSMAQVFLREASNLDSQIYEEMLKSK
jgi:hypothetical protein